MTNPNYTITLTRTQADLISQACDLIARLGIGQWPEFIRHLPGDIALRGYHHARESLQPVMSDLLAQYPIGPNKIVINGWGSHLGIFNPNAPECARRAMDIHKVVRHRLSWDWAEAEGMTDGKKRTPEMIGFNYDTPRRSSDQPLPTIKRDTP